MISRRRITFDADEVALSTSTSWFDGSLAGKCPALLRPDRIPQGTSHYIEEQTGRAVTSGRDHLAASAATDEHAKALGVHVGSPVLLGRNRWLDEHGDVVEYGESASPPDRWAFYEYTIGSQQ